MSSPPTPGLYIVATPIGNLGDLSPRARAILTAADVVACEDTRVTGKLLHLSGIKRPLLRHDDHASDAQRAALVARLGAEVVALVCDAGTPLISDPGYRLVRDARAAGHSVTSIPGPCAAITALTLSGLPTDRFLFVGFLPAKPRARDVALGELAATRATLIFYESGPRLAASLNAMHRALGPREACVARELTKLHEDVQTGTLAELAAHYATPPKGEIVIIVAPAEASVPVAARPEEIRRTVAHFLTLGPPSRAARDAARQLGISRDEAYAVALALIADGKGGTPR